MKKILMIISISMMCSLLFLFKAKPLQVSAVNNRLDVSVKYLTTEDAENYNSISNGRFVFHEQTLQEGDYSVSLTIENNTGFAATGYRIYIHPSLCTPITYTDGSTARPIYYKGDVLNESNLTPSVGYNPEEHILAFSTIGYSNATLDGIVVTFFLRPTHELSLTEQQHLVTDHGIDKWLDRDTHYIGPAVNNGFTLYRYMSNSSNNVWIIGDIDHDGEVTVADAQLILGLYVDYNIGDSSTIFTTEYIGTFILDNNDEVDKLYVVSVCDVNEDGVIDVEDANDVLSYYITYVSGQGNLNNYTGIIGTEFGYYVLYDVDFA